MTELVMSDDDFPHGLRCGACDREIGDGQPYSERLDEVGTLEGEPTFYSTLVCVPCGLAVATGQGGLR